MKRLHIAELLTVVAVLAFVLWPPQEPAKVVAPPVVAPMILGLTAYGRDAINPACAAMRNNTIGAPFLPEPNRDDIQKAQRLWGGDPSFLGNSGYARKQYAEAFALLQKIDDEGTERLGLLPSDTPRIDFVIDRHVANLALGSSWNLPEILR